jgi:hypothetical protein
MARIRDTAQALALRRAHQAGALLLLPMGAAFVFTHLACSSKLRVQNKTFKLKVKVILRRRKNHTALRKFMQLSRTFSDRFGADTTDALKQQHNGYTKYALVLYHKPQMTGRTSLDCRGSKLAAGR